MSRQHNLNRRSVLKKLGAGGVAATGLPAVVSAEEKDTVDDHVKKVLQNEKVQSIQDEVGEFNVNSYSKKKIKQESSTVTATWIETDIGTLSHIKENSGDTKVFLVLSDVTEGSEEKSRLPSRYQDIPDVSQVTLTGKGSSVSMDRAVTDKEREKLEDAVGNTGESFIPAYREEIKGYEVTVIDSNENEQTYIVGRDSGEITAENVEIQFTTMGCCDSCISTVAGRGLCYASCYLAGSVAGGVVCLACLAKNGYDLTTNCDGCHISCA